MLQGCVVTFLEFSYKTESFWWVNVGILNIYTSPMDAFGYFFVVVQGFLLENLSCSVDVYLPRLLRGVGGVE